MRDLPTTMTAVLLTGHGGPEVLETRHDVPVPQPGPGEVLIKVAASAVNNTDINTRIAWYSKTDGDADDVTWSGTPMKFPRIQGADICGWIVAVGAGIDGGRMGDRVLVEPCLVEAGGKPLPVPWYIGSECDGGFADYAVVASRHAVVIDSSLTDIELASFPCSYSTAENMLVRAEAMAGDRIW